MSVRPALSACKVPSEGCIVKLWKTNKTKTQLIKYTENSKTIGHRNILSSSKPILVLVVCHLSPKPLHRCCYSLGMASVFTSLVPPKQACLTSSLPRLGPSAPALSSAHLCVSLHFCLRLSHPNVRVPGRACRFPLACNLYFVQCLAHRVLG